MLDKPAQAVDQRVKFPRWMQELEKRGGTIEYQAGNARRSRQIRRRFRSRHCRRRQRRHRQDFRARRAKVAVRRAAARAGADLRQRADAAAAALGGLLQPDPRRRRIFRLPVADDDRTVRDHGARGRSRRPDGLLGRRQDAGASISPNRNGFWRHSCPGRPSAQRTSSSPMPTASSVGRFAPTVRKPIAQTSLRQSRVRHGRRRGAQRSDHRARLQQRFKMREDLSRRHCRERRQAIRSGLDAGDLRPLSGITCNT